MAAGRVLQRAIRSRDASIDQVELPADVPGALWLCGKRAIAPDVGAALRRVGGNPTVVCLVERAELARRYPEYVAWLERVADERAIWWPIDDFGAPALPGAVESFDRLAGMLRAGATLLVHCGAGVGRTATVAIGTLIRLGLPAHEATRRVAAARPGAGPETSGQRRLIQQIATKETTR